MRTPQEIQERRNVIRHYSGQMVDLGNLINDVMAEVPHSRGTAYRSLKNKSNEYIVHINSSRENCNLMHIVYRSEDGNLYEIDFKQAGTKNDNKTRTCQAD